jgi:hypothetical protein
MVVRNGHLPEREIVSGIGPIKVRQPRVRHRDGGRVAQYGHQKIYQIDPQTGAILRTIKSNRFVTGVTWIEGELWHGTWEGDESDLRRVDPQTGEVLERLEMPPGVGVSGLESDGGDQFLCGGGSSGKVRIVRRPRRDSAAGGGSTSK